jgi:uncharacterized protein (DUF488 family)
VGLEISNPATEPRKRVPVWTVGHGSDSFFAFDLRLEPYGIAAVADVRSQPASRHAPDFRKPELEEHTTDAGLGYRWLGRGLGGRPEAPALRRDDGSADYAAIAEDPRFLASLDELIGLAGAARTAILCAEYSPDDCHRSLLIAPELEARGFEVIHILGDGSTRPHHSALPFT